MGSLRKDIRIPHASLRNCSSSNPDPGSRTCSLDMGARDTNHNARFVWQGCSTTAPDQENVNDYDRNMKIRTGLVAIICRPAFCPCARGHGQGCSRCRATHRRMALICYSYALYYYLPMFCIQAISFQLL